MSRILIVTTSHTAIPGTADATGVWYEELAAPWCLFTDAGHEVTIASIRGGEVPIDGFSLAETPPPRTVSRFRDDPAAIAAAHRSIPVADIDPAGYDAIFLPGGHGTMWDYPGNPALAALVSTMLGDGRLVAAVCHGPAGLIGATRPDGGSMIKGRSVTCFADSEERAIHLDGKMPFLLETALRDLGAQVSVGPDFAPHVMEDGNLLTGQNPKSAEPLARAVIDALKAGRTKAA